MWPVWAVNHAIDQHHVSIVLYPFSFGFCFVMADRNLIDSNVENFGMDLLELAFVEI